MLANLKRTAKSKLDSFSLPYNVLAWCYSWIAGRPSIRRAAYMRMFKDSRFAATELHMASLCPSGILDAVIERWHPRSFLDVGCGTGQTIKYVSNRGIECLGLEGSAAAIDQSPVKQQIRMANLNEPLDLGRRFDVVWSFEVAEHIHPKFTETFLDTLTSHGDLMVLSAAQPGQGGAGHFNEQPLSYWIERITRRGFVFEEQFTKQLHALSDEFSGNMMVFTRENI
jgi:SAM-dependent methyltransferase